VTRGAPADRGTTSSASEADAPVIDVVIPAYNEEDSIGLVLADIPPGFVRRVVVADNNSRDATAVRAREAGAEVVPAPVQGYGSACLAALGHVGRTGPPDVVVFLDADYSDHPEEMPGLVEPIARGEIDLVIGSRVLGEAEPGALLPQARWGNRFACCSCGCCTATDTPTWDRSEPSPGEPWNRFGCGIRTSAGQRRCRSRLYDGVCAWRRSL